MFETFENFLKKYKIQNKKVIVGFSGGPDSCAMTFILSKLAKKYNLEIIIAYFNHNWRIEESHEEEIFALEFSKKINAQFYTSKAPLDYPKTEEAARELRYNFFENCMKKYNSEIVFLGHNKNDNIETLIYRVIKGTGIKGLCSIPQQRENYYRPMLTISKEDILNFLEKNNIEYKFDSSNNDVKYKRNLIRKEILPIFEKINPNYLNNIENLIQNAISSREIIDSEIEKVKNKLIVSNEIVNREDFIQETKSVRYEILNDFLGDKLKYRNYKNIKKFDDFILNNKNSQISVNRELFLKIKKNKIYFIEHNNYENKE